MYKHLEAKDYKRHLDIPEEYQVDGVLVAGTWKVDREFERIVSLAKQYNSGAKIQRIPYEFIGIGQEIIINGKRIWIFVMYGGVMLSEFVHLGCIFGSKKNILVGVAGGLKPGIKIADVVLPTESYKDGSMSTLYDRNDDVLIESDDSLRSNIKAKLSSEHKVYEGKTMTCQAMMAETEEDVKKWSEQGYLAVEMEAATVFAVSKHFNVPAAALLSVADNLIEDETVFSENYQVLAEIRAKVRDEQYLIALDELINS
ncbi:hypothetical protein COU91_00860 [Candidatus Saccharibacteria bacterium CG10_big_fil_rev_8_21_14_0_10_47_8]|nr:MAG: hypothetical protein COU91_00860 [Candidatus Saccharibacteria bacterium CG10_big_fil_rev_8_21_14_0_10_47_8]